MRRPRQILFLSLIAVLFLLTSCGGGSGAAGSSEDPASGADPNDGPVKTLDQGEIIQINENRWLITAYVEEDDGQYVDAYWLTITDRTILQDHSGQTVQADTLKVGARVEAWHSGPVMESYPMQTEAAKIVLLDNGQEAPEGHD